MMHYSVITINLNNCEGLCRTIKSVVGQTLKDFEYIVIDGGSTDESVDVIRNNEDHITYWVSERDNGIYHAMNKGVSKAHGDYCIFMNSGDCFYNNNVLDHLKGYGAEEDVIVGKVSIDENNHVISPPPKDELTLYHLYYGAIPHQGSFIRTDLLRKYPYDESLKISSDWKFFIQALIVGNCSIRYVNEFVAKYDMNGISTANSELMRMEKDNVLATLFPPRVLADYQRMKKSECLTLSLTPQLRKYYSIDRILYTIGHLLLKIRSFI